MVEMAIDTEFSERELSKVYGMGNGCLKSVKELLALFGLSLR